MASRAPALLYLGARSKMVQCGLFQPASESDERPDAKIGGYYIPASRAEVKEPRLAPLPTPLERQLGLALHVASGLDSPVRESLVPVSASRSARSGELGSRPR